MLPYYQSPAQILLSNKATREKVHKNIIENSLVGVHWKIFFNRQLFSVFSAGVRVYFSTANVKGCLINDAKMKSSGARYCLSAKEYFKSEKPLSAAAEYGLPKVICLAPFGLT